MSIFIFQDIEKKDLLIKVNEELEMDNKAHFDNILIKKFNI